MTISSSTSGGNSLGYQTPTPGPVTSHVTEGLKAELAKLGEILEDNRSTSEVSRQVLMVALPTHALQRRLSAGKSAQAKRKAAICKVFLKNLSTLMDDLSTLNTTVVSKMRTQSPKPRRDHNIKPFKPSEASLAKKTRDSEETWLEALLDRLYSAAGLRKNKKPKIFPQEIPTVDYTCVRRF